MTEKSEETKKTKIRSTLKYPLPDSRISFDKHLEIIKAYVVVSKNGQESVTYKSFKNVVDFHPNVISGNNEFFENIGLIREVEGQRGKYIPTEKAINLFNALKWKKEEEVKSFLKEVLSPSWFWNLTKQVLDVNVSATRTELRDKLGYESNADPKKHNPSLNVLIDYLLYAGLIKEDEEGKLIYTNPEVHNETPTEAQHETSERPRTKPIAKEGKLPVSLNGTIPQLVLGIMLTSDTSEEQIRKFIRIIRDEWKKLSETGD